jgi:pimeloyl-ACP methyl ester carboxylesterase
MRSGVLALAMVLGLVPGSRGNEGPKTGLEGNWEGTLKAGPLELRLAFHVTKGKAGAFRATFDSLDQGATGLPVEEAKQDGKAVTFTLKSLSASFEGKLDEAEATIAGTFKQAGAEFPLTLKRVDKVSMPRRPQTPKVPFPYREEAVRVENREGKATLAGTLTVPPGKGPFPAAILISGSGSQDRDETIFGHKPFLVLADALTRRGVAVLRVDDRGVGQSTGGVLDSTSEDMAGDVRAELAFLRSRPEIDPKRIGLIGHSEGGLIAPMVAAKDHEVAFIVLLAGTALPGEEILYQQGRGRAEGPASRGEADPQRARDPAQDLRDREGGEGPARRRGEGPAGPRGRGRRDPRAGQGPEGGQGLHRRPGRDGPFPLAPLLPDLRPEARADPGEMPGPGPRRHQGRAGRRRGEPRRGRDGGEVRRQRPRDRQGLA